jgi:hypothetical protein
VQGVGKLLFAFGLLLALLGAVVWAAPSVPWLGRLPGDLRIERPGLRIYLPIATSLLVSALLSALLWLVSRLR